MNTTNTKRVLIADDDSSSLYRLRWTMGTWGYEVQEATDGPTAWALLDSPDAPPLAILDWMMPGMNGLEICRRLVAEAKNSSIYVILLTARDHLVDRLQGLDAGAHDFITKPYDLTEIKRRVAVAQRIIDTQATIILQREEIREYAQQMEALAERRAKQILHADRLATLGTLSASMAHEISNPVTMSNLSLQALEKQWRRVAPILGAACSRADEAHTVDRINESIETLNIANERIARLVRGMRSFARKDEERQSLCDANAIVATSIDLVQARLRGSVETRTALHDQPLYVRATPQQIEQVLINLLVNAADAMEGIAEPRIDIATSTHESNIVIEVADTGRGIPPDILDSIWEPYYTTKPDGQGTGLGLSISKSIVTGHGGTITAANRPDGGACFRIELPAQAPREPLYS